MAQDEHRQALERFEDARDAVSAQYAKMRDDLRFSDPTDPKQWDDAAMQLRKGRPCLTFDRTNQFISQVVNSGRQNKPAIHCLPANSEAAIEVAEKLNGIIRHIEYVSRAGIAYDTALECAARIGIGWMRVVPEIMRPETNEQEIRIKRVHDPLSVYLEAGWSEPDGSDAMHGFVETLMTTRAFKSQYPKASDQSWEGASPGWFEDKMVRLCEYLCIVETKENRLSIELEGQSMTLGEDEYWQLRQQTGMEIPATPFVAKIRSVKWLKLSGAEVLEETEFPSQYLPLIPIVGHEIWVDGQRHLCGMTRRLMDSQRAYNYERSAFIEAVAMQPKAPFLIAGEAMEGYEDSWARLNQGNPSFLPFNHLDEAGNPIPVPQRQHPPDLPVSFVQGGQIASQDMESAVGMFRANLGAPGAAVSGRAKREDKVAGDTANFHYTDNLSRSIEQLGRVVVDMIPRVFDTPRQARIVGEDGSHEFVQVDPGMQQAVQKQGKKVTAINPAVGAYDVRVKTGPAYTTLREESAEQLANMMQAAPSLMPILGDLWVGMQDWPEAEVAKKRLAAMLPPQIQQMEQEDGEDIPPQAQAQLMQMQQQLQQMQQALQEASQAADQNRQKAEQAMMQHKTDIARLHVDNYNAETARLKVQAELQAKTQHVAMAEQAKTDTAVQVAQINANSRQDVASIAALTQLELASMQPTPELEGEMRDADD
jgi:uncharacterized membrane protein